ncbi:ATP-binding SpoIIE family protein phosphatase [Pseudonocardia pini]|uniref:ATP-binding SpoIIE family protein phosphatase n=1 Tax=Pseudonocardia pini TaxID=2758030 RepID=UPI0015F06163|nr:SpoIIE family protein phosphatase [Pseudonocardia pini]
MTEPMPPIAAPGQRETTTAPVRVLLVEDDDADALLVSELFTDGGEIRDVVHVHRLGEALPLLGSADCVLLDMNLPDAAGLDGLARLLAVEGHPAIVVLTGDVDETRGRAAVAAGAEDYLIKGRVDGQLLTRAVHYAVERRHAEHLTRQLDQARAHERENRRLGRGLLPTPLLCEQPLRLTTRYQPGERQLLLGGDFYDCIETDDGTVHVIIGDVSGHGPDEAAVGVSLRIAWRTLILAGVPAAHVLPILDKVLVTERHDPTLFTTVAMVSVAADRDRLALYLAGHPAPLLLDGTVPRLLPDHALGVPLGVRLGTTWPPVEVPLPRDWALMLYTDGLIEARDAAGEVLWTDGLLELLTPQLAAAGPAWPDDPDRVLDTLLIAVDERAPLRGDDLAVALLTRTGPVPPTGLPTISTGDPTGDHGEATVPREDRTDAEVRRMQQHYEPTPESCGRVRRDVRVWLGGWGVDEDATEAAVLVANELASNAVDHARTPFTVALTLGAASLTLELVDGSADEPQLQVHDVTAVRGRGLQMVEALSSTWTFHHHETGKTVTAEIALDGPVVYP